MGKQHAKKMLCPEYTSYRDDSIVNDCNYYAWASDGHKYVWAASMAGDHHVQAFDIDTGDYAGYINTCSTPIDMEYHPARREMYVRCAQSTDTHPGEIDVFSSANLSSDIPMIKVGDTVRPYGRLAVHSAMGPYAYSLAYDQSYISELDLSSKTSAATYEIPDAYGGYDATYSPVNNHLYFRARVCCFCGADADVLRCGYGANPTIKQVLVKTAQARVLSNRMEFAVAAVRDLWQILLESTNLILLTRNLLQIITLSLEQALELIQCHHLMVNGSSFYQMTVGSMSEF